LYTTVLYEFCDEDKTGADYVTPFPMVITHYVVIIKDTFNLFKIVATSVADPGEFCLDLDPTF
jgi:hypothetical protein